MINKLASLHSDVDQVDQVIINQFLIIMILEIITLGINFLATVSNRYQRGQRHCTGGCGLHITPLPLHSRGV